jgi:uncharacterized membrane protein
VAAWVAVDRRDGVILSPLHAVLLAGIVPLFLGVLLCDWAYGSTYEIQWKNFASWLIVGALVYGGVALLWSLIDLVRADRRGGRPLLYFLLLLAAWVLGFINALVHAKDAWASMPAALILSVIGVLLAVAATVLGFTANRAGKRP